MRIRLTIGHATTYAAICAFGFGLIAIGGWIIDPKSFYPAWLAAFCYALGLPLGALALLLIHDLTGGKWETIARSPLEAAVATMPLFIVLFVPILGGAHELYPWVRPERSGTLANGWYLNPGFFGLRAAAYFAVWNTFAFLQLYRRPAQSFRPSQWLSGIGLVLLAYSTTYAAIDWMMSTEPEWFSSIYGMATGASWFVASLAAAILALISSTAPTERATTSFRVSLAQLATILLAVDIFWAYTAFSQWIIIWEENLHHEITWYLERLRDEWRIFVLVAFAAGFFFPLFALVWTPAKRDARLVATVCVSILVGSLFYMWWLILPAFHPATFGWLEPVVMIWFCSMWICLFLWHLRRGFGWLTWTQDRRDA